MAAGHVADRPGGAGVAGRGGQRVVAALSVGLPDRMDRRQVDHVEAELGQARQLALDAVQAAPGAREQLIPGAEAGARTVDVRCQRCVQLDRAVPDRVALDRRRELVAEGRVVLGGRRRGGFLELGDRVLDRRAVVAVVGVRGGGPQQHDPLRQLPGEVGLAARELAPQLVAPGRELVGPRLDRVPPDAGTVDRERAGPADAAEVGVGPAQLGLADVAVGIGVTHDGAQQLVAVSEHVGGDRDGVAGAALDRVGAVVDGGDRVLDHDPAGLGPGRRRSVSRGGCRRAVGRGGTGGHVPSTYPMLGDPLNTGR